MSMIESYFHDGLGYNPFLIREGWQVAQLNHLPELAPQAIRRIERHNATDEVFILVEGNSVLIAAEETPDGLQWDACGMEPGVTYNIPTGMWHSIAMTPADLVIIVENANTHLNDVEYRDLSDEERAALQAVVDRELAS
jgi:ureidoglycolate hydrolase